jgi:hypothetical protein
MASIQEVWLKIKNWTDLAIGEWGLIAIIFLVGLASFGLGRLSVLETVRPPVSITNAPTIAEPRGMNIGFADRERIPFSVVRGRIKNLIAKSGLVRKRRKSAPGGIRACQELQRTSIESIRFTIFCIPY